MAWVNLTDLELAPDAKIKSTQGLAFRDNPIAIAQGLAGAPKILTAGINDAAVTPAKLANPFSFKTYFGTIDGIGNVVLDNTFDWRDRFMIAFGGVASDALLADVQTWIPGGGQDNDIYHGAADGSSSVCTYTNYFSNSSFMYTRTGGATYNTIPYVHIQVDVAGFSGYLWVNSADGSLNFYVNVNVFVAYNFIIGFSADLGGH